MRANASTHTHTHSCSRVSVIIAVIIDVAYFYLTHHGEWLAGANFPADSHVSYRCAVADTQQIYLVCPNTPKGKFSQLR